MNTRFFAALLFSFFVDSALVCGQEPEEPFEIAARLKLPAKERFPGNRAFRAVALRMPWVYVLDRQGHLYVFEVLRSDRDEEREALRVLDDVGDGNDLAMFGNVLALTRQGRLEIYSLEDPARPEHLGRFGPDEERQQGSQAIIRHGDRAFLVGKGGIVSYDLAAPSTSKLLSIYETKWSGFAGCASGEVLAVSAFDPGRTRECGIATYDISDAQAIKEIGFVPCRQLPYHLLPLPKGRVLASVSAVRDLRFLLGLPSVPGSADIYDLARPEMPAKVNYYSDAGGRTATLLPTKEALYLICDRAIYRVEDDTLEFVQTFRWDGSNLDGFPYHADSDWARAALVGDDEVTVLRLTKSKHDRGS